MQSVGGIASIAGVGLTGLLDHLRLPAVAVVERYPVGCYPAGSKVPNQATRAMTTGHTT